MSTEHRGPSSARSATSLLQSAIDVSRDGVAILDADGLFRYVNAAHAALYGYASGADMHGIDWRTLYGDAELQRFEREVMPELARAGSWFGRAFGQCHDGSFFPQEVSLTVLPDGGLVCVVRDISERDELERRLRSAEANYRGIFEQATEGIYRSTAEGRFVRANPAMIRLLGYTSEQAMLDAGIDIAEGFYVEPDRRREIVELLNRRGRVRSMVSAVQRPTTGERLWISENAHCIHDDEGRFVYYEGTIEDITELVRQQHELAYSEQRFQDVLRAAGEFVWETDHERHIEFVSERVTAAVGYAVDDLIGRDLADLVTAEGAEAIARHLPLERAVSPDSDPRNFEIDLRDKAGNSRWLRLSAVPRRDEAGRFLGWRGTGLETTSRKAAEDRAHYLARHDELTGLPRRGTFNERLDRSLASAKRRHARVGVLFIDLDRFKEINDIFGHAVGDRVLVAIAERLRSQMRRPDLLSRLSGDEFGAIIEDVVDSTSLMPLIQRLLHQFESPFLVDEHQLQVSASIGIFLAEDDHESADTVLNYADSAMYQAKQSGRATFRFFDPDLDAAAKRRIELAGALREALAEEQFSLVLQPQIALDDHRIVAAEALLRWRHPVLGNVSPGEFIPVAEQTGLILPLGEWVLDEVCRTLAQHEHWGGLRVFANVSPVQIAQSDLSTSVARALERHAVPVERLGLEITESTLMRCTAEEVAGLIDLSHRGISLALDDFGTGYSSLGYLREFPASHLKIDISFVQRSITTERDRTIVTTVAELAHNLGLYTVAEGTETAEHVATMKAIGCRSAQGYYYTKPLELEAFERFLSDHHRSE